MDYDEILRLIQQNLPETYRSVMESLASRLGTEDLDLISRKLRDPDYEHVIFAAIDEWSNEQNESQQLNDEIENNPEFIKFMDRYIEEEWQKRNQKQEGQ